MRLDTRTLVLSHTGYDRIDSDCQRALASPHAQHTVRVFVPVATFPYMDQDIESGHVREEHNRATCEGLKADIRELRQQLDEARSALRLEKTFRTREGERFVATEAALRQSVRLPRAVMSHRWLPCPRLGVSMPPVLQSSWSMRSPAPSTCVPTVRLLRINCSGVPCC